MNYIKVICSITVVCCLLLNGCSKAIAPGDYDTSEVGKIKKVVPGVIISKRPVNLHNRNTDALTGNVNPSAPAPNAPTGDYVDVNRSHGFEYVIKLSSGSIISVVQTEDLNLKTKQHILVIYGDNTRVVADEGNDD